jgi:PPM family protein phosphatase
MLTLYARSERGPVRDTNEDAVLTDRALGLVAIADGMGGHNAGEIAAAIALASIHAFIKQTARDWDFTWPCAIDPALSADGNRLLAAVTVANRAVFTRASQDDACTGMGTTIVAALVDGSRVTFATVGDSRIYVAAGSTLTQVSRDDSWIEKLAEQSKVAVETLRNHPMRNVLTNVVGVKPTVVVHVESIDLGNGQTIVMTTDGVHGFITADAMAGIVEAAADLPAAAERIIGAALDAGGTDNASVALARYSA